MNRITGCQSWAAAQKRSKRRQVEQAAWRRVEQAAGKGRAGCRKRYSGCILVHIRARGSKEADAVLDDPRDVKGKMRILWATRPDVLLDDPRDVKAKLRHRPDMSSDAEREIIRLKLVFVKTIIWTQ